MSQPSVQFINRRAFIRAAGISLALPRMASLSHALGEAASKSPASDRVRMVCVGNSFGMYPPEFFPQQEGRDFDLPHLLEPLAGHRGGFSVFSNLDHGIKGGHFAVHSFLSGVKTEEAKSMPEGNITVDQRAAEHVGSSARFPSLTVGSDSGLHGGCRMSWTRSGSRVPPIVSPRELFNKLFVEDAPNVRRRERELMQLKGSILDAVNEDANSLSRRLDGRDRDKLDEYLTSVRDVEKRIAQQENWQNIPKPSVDYPQPEYKGIVQDLPSLFDLIALALQTNSTRVATLEVASQGFNTGALGVKGGYHSLSHHGKKPESIKSLLKIERYQTEQFARFLDKLKALSAADEEGSLFENTMVLFGSGMGNGNAHTNTNLPLILAGAGFRLGEHKAYPTKRREPLCNLFLSMLQRFGVETDSFGRSTGTLSGLDVA